MSDAPTIRPFPLQAGHPANHGYVQCTRCVRWLAARSSTTAPAAGVVGVVPVCADVAACSEQARATGRLETP